METEFSAYDQNDILADLEANVTDGEVFIDHDMLEKQSFSANLPGQHGLAIAFVEAKSVEDVQGVMATARKFHLPVVTQNRFTSTVVGADAVDGAVILSTAKMDQILELNQTDAYAVVQPGVINAKLDEAARKQGLFYAPDPASKPMSGIGGNIATNAGGLSGVRYGSTRDNVLGLKVVLADGRILKLGGKTTKQAFGYDLTQLFVGSEGTLGVIVEATVKLMPLPLGDSLMGLAFFKDMPTLAEATTELRMSGIYPAMLEAMDVNTLKAIDAYKGTNYSSKSGAALILRVDSITPEGEQIIKQILTKYQAGNVQLTTDEKEQEAIIAVRQAMLPAIFTGRNAVMEDMAVPTSKMAELVAYIQKIGEENEVEIFTAGHAGDGNLHPTVTWSKDTTATPEAVKLVLRQMFKKALDLGGTISGEHAVGMLKNQWNNVELGSDVDYVQHQIKALFDPMNLLNPKRKIN
ncbi:FAD-binding oxidoreductase [Lactobacillus sp. 3B(2020)]|uniref:FAD-binding oxidoreductase n=1 Tax=Lactobacillus sp. 3B(2020) TaxID=2695882 RepID=UPI0015DECE48|nr:FAD-linked oxidase C-terminal domain-containing protein [Lactobacillus sp. 3B(2020)]QLL70052.1 FAD-binding protein [Lactobacillus sp. 3B(2020)]